LVDTDDIEDVMLPYGDVHYENPLYVQLEEGSWARESPKVQNQGPKVHAVFQNGKAKLVPEEHRIAGESPELDKPYTFHILSLDTSDQGTFK
jgi:hypothetical protein